MPETLPVSLIKPFELLGGALISGKLMARKHLRLVVAFEQLLGDRGAQHVDNDGARHGRSRTRAPIETLQLEHAVAQRTVIVDHDIAKIDELFSRGMSRGDLLTVLTGDDAD